MPKPKPRYLPRTIFGYQVTAHAQERFHRRFRGHDLEESLKRAEVISCKMARKLTFDVPSTFGGADFFLYDQLSQAVYIIRECQHYHAVVTVIKTAWGKMG